MRSESGRRFGVGARAALVALSVCAGGCLPDLPDRDDADDETLEPVDDSGSDSTVDQRDARSDDARDAQTDGARDAADAQDGKGAGDAADPLPPLDLALSTTEGAAPLWMEATPPASTPTHPLVVTYDWGEGAGPETTSSHYYVQPGEYTVTQEVHDAAGAVIDTSTELVKVVAYPAVRWSTTDKSPCSYVSADGYSVEARDWGPCGTRTTAAIAPRSGVFYFEAKRLGPGGSIGVATASADLLGSVGGTADTMGILGFGPIRTNNVACSGAPNFNMRFADVGFVIDYRGASPVVHVISSSDDETDVEVRASCSMATTAPLFAIYSGERRMVGYEVKINTGADTTNLPFYYDGEAIKKALGASNARDAADVLVMGFGATRAGRPSAKPTLSLSGPTLVTSLNIPITISGVASDAEDGALTSKITWSDVATLHHVQPNATGASYTFTPTEPGRHPIIASVTDSDGVTTTVEKLVDVQAALPVLPVAQVKLVKDPATTNAAIVVSPDGLSAHFEEDHKNGIRANQGLYGDFWYFEVLRNTPVRNMGMGVVIKDGTLNPYDFATVPWSMSINVSNGFWHNLIGEGAYSPAAAPNRDVPEHYGFAVDYRGQHPIVHVIVRGVVQTSMEMNDVWTPLYPMIYGNGGGPAGALDMTVNFGAQPFRFNPTAILGAKGAGLKLGWGQPAQTLRGR